ncbi:glycosyltransferase [Opitutaceae bacterium TAV4]|uniref:glycosyltransferase n=1 Tax=Geminisphaera colitermitum TaxID=1148786 RepID=UPI000158D2AA|nr:glycosyltransferase [Geminisphaera colitermitum]RRJ96471.1 glycosyltransferase [Opitutaceae bacterium TAV4]RRJ99812.1 glycosyltransferase [Opitutaceae bacterium TAV3]
MKPASRPGNERRVVIFKKDLIAYSETFVVEQAANLSRYKPAFFGFNHLSSGDDLLKNFQVEFLSTRGLLGWGRRQALRAGWVAPRWRRQLERFDPHLVHAQFGFSGLPALHLACCAGVPLVVTFQGSDITTRPSPAYLHARRRVYRDAAAILGVGNHLCEKLIADGCPPEKVTFLTTGVDCRKFDAPSEAIRRPTLLFIGRFVEKKGIALLLAAMPAIIKAVPEVNLELIGSGPDQLLVDEAARQYPNNITIRGKQPHAEVIATLRRTTLHCMPSLPASSGDSEGLPTVLLETQAAGVPPVAFDTAGVREAIDNGKTGLLVPPGDVPAMADAIVTLLRNESRRIAMSEAARQHIRTHFDVRNQCAKLETIYDRAIEDYMTV